MESALIYTFELMLLIILSFAKSPVQYVVQAAIIPSIGKYGYVALFSSFGFIFGSESRS